MITRLEAVHVLKEILDNNIDIKIPHADKAKEAIQEGILALNTKGSKWIPISTLEHMYFKCEECGCIVMAEAINFGHLRFCPNCGCYNQRYCFLIRRRRRMKRKIEELEKVTKPLIYCLDVKFSIIDESEKFHKYRFIKNLDEDEAREELKKYFEIYEKALDEKRVISFERIFMFRI